MKERREVAMRVAGSTLMIGVAALSLSLARTSVAQGGAPVARLRAPVILDGTSNEQAWQGIEPLPMIMFMPDHGQPPSERTEVLLGHDGQFLYVAGRLYDSEPEKIGANSLQRDSPDGSSDWFGVVIDSFNDKENALAFFTTPTGLRWDAAIENDYGPPRPENRDWNTFWDVRVARTVEGWFAELRIPFSSLRFQDRDGRVVMGLITWRGISRRNEYHCFPAVPPSWGFDGLFKPSQAAEIVLDGVRARRRPVIVAPYALGGLTRRSAAGGQATALSTVGPLEIEQHELGADVKFGIGSNLTLDVTFNPDFAQIEADDVQLNLERFSMFFPEKRPFFQERAASFEFNFDGYDRLFHSRRIGLEGGAPVPIDLGVRLTGRLGAWDLGLLDVQTAGSAIGPAQNAGVLRARRQVVNAYSSVGGMLTTRVGEDGTARAAYGLDGVFRLFGSDVLSIKWAQSFDEHPGRELLSLDPARLLVRWQRRTLTGLGYDLWYSRGGEDYDPPLGFARRTDYAQAWAGMVYGWPGGEGSRLQRQRLHLDASTVERNADGSTEVSKAWAAWVLEWRSGWTAVLGSVGSSESLLAGYPLADGVAVAAGDHRYAGANVELYSPSGRSVGFAGWAYAGGFYDGDRVAFGLSPRWNVGPRLELRASVEHNLIRFPERAQELRTTIGRLRALVMFSTAVSLGAFVQYNGAGDTATANLRLRYNPREGIDVYLVADETRPLHGDASWRRPGRARSVAVKYTHAFLL